MEITGRIAFIQPVVTGVGKTGEPWKKQTFVLMTTDQNPKYFAFEIMDGRNGNIARYNIQMGKTYTVDFDIRAGEWQGKWYNHVQVWNVREVTDQAQQPEQQQTK